MTNNIPTKSRIIKSLRIGGIFNFPSDFQKGFGCSFVEFVCKPDLANNKSKMTLFMRSVMFDGSKSVHMCSKQKSWMFDGRSFRNSAHVMQNHKFSAPIDVIPIYSVNILSNFSSWIILLIEYYLLFFFPFWVCAYQQIYE